MKCPKCSYVSHDYLDACRKCGVDLVSFKQGMGLLVLQPGVLDLSFVLGEAGTDDLFESVEEEVIHHDGHDGDFDINLDDHPEHPEARSVSGRIPRPAGLETAEERPALDHLTLQLDVSGLSAELAASLPGGLADTPPRPPAAPPAVPGGSSPLDHITLDIEPDSGGIALPSGAFAELTTMPPGPEPTATPVARPETPENVAEDVVLAEDIPVAPALEEQAPELVDLALPTIELLDVEAVADRGAAEMRPEAPEGPEGVDLATMTLDSFAVPTLDDATVMVTDENVPPTQPAHELTAAAGETSLEDALTPADMLILADVEGATLPGQLTLDSGVPETGAEQDVTVSEALPLGDAEDTLLPGGLTLDLDMSEIMTDWSSETLADVQLDAPPGEVQSETSPPQNQAGEEEALLLDLDEAVSDDDTPA